MGISIIDSTQSGFQWVADRVWKVEHAFERANASGVKASSTRMRAVPSRSASQAVLTTLAVSVPPRRGWPARTPS